MATRSLKISYDRSKFLGGGGFSKVFGGKYGDKQVAVKRTELPSQSDSETRREIENQQMLNHENVLKFYETEQDLDFRYIALEMCAGTLEDVIEKKETGPLDLPADKIVLYQIANGLDYIHSQRLIHRDIKPANILISFDSIIKISDFGLSKKISANSTCNMSGLKGTPLWMPPEFFGDERNIQTKGTRMSDIFSTGLVFFMFLTRHEGGVHPFGNKNDQIGVQSNIRNNKPVNIKGVTGELIELTLGMIQHEPEKRLSLEIVKEGVFLGLEIRKIDIKSLIEKKIERSEEIASRGETHVRFHPTESAAIIFCNKKLFFVKENYPQESFELWQWYKVDDVEIDAYDLQWNADGSQLAILLWDNKMPYWDKKITIYNYTKSTTNNEISINLDRHAGERDLEFDNRCSDFTWNPFAVNQIAVFNKISVSGYPLWIIDTQNRGQTTVKIQFPVSNFEWIGKNSFAVTSTTEIHIYELNGSATNRIKTFARTIGGLFIEPLLKWNPTFSFLAVYFYGHIEIWEMGENDPIFSLVDNTEKDSIWFSMDWFPNDKLSDERYDNTSRPMDILLARARRDGTIEIWKLNYADKSIQSMNMLSGPKLANGWVQVSFSPNGKYFASWNSYELMIWDTEIFKLRFKSLPMQFRMPSRIAKENRIWDRTGTRFSFPLFNFVYEIM